MAQSNDQTIIDYITTKVLSSDGKHKHLGEVCVLLYKNVLRSTVENGVFVIYYKDTDGTWIRYGHRDLVLNQLRTGLCSYIDKARYSLQSPKPTDSDYSKKIEIWQNSILKLLKIHEQLHDYTFMKCVLEEFTLSVHRAII
jgi:hypothetical protein